MRTGTSLLVSASILPLLLPVMLPADDLSARGEPPAAYGAKQVLAVCDFGGGKESLERVGPKQTAGGRTFRAYPGKGTWAYVHLKRWWDEGAKPPADIVLAVTYRDTLSDGLALYGWTGVGGRYGFHYFGQLRGVGDGEWKTALIYLAREFVTCPADGSHRGTWRFQINGKLAADIDKIELVRPDKALAAEALRQGRAARAAARAVVMKQFKHVSRPKPAALGAVAEADRKRGFIGFVRSHTADVFPDAVPTASERAVGRLEAYATPGEFEPLQVAARALVDRTVTATVTDLAGPGGKLAAGKDVILRTVECVPARAGGGSSAKGWQVQPAWLRTNAPVAVPAGEARAWQVTVRVPAGAKPGDYRGTLTLSADGGKVAWPIRFRVLPFALDAAPHVARGAYISSILSEELIASLRDHGCNAASMWVTGGLAPTVTDGRCTAAVTPAMDRYLKALKAAGFVNMVFFGGGDNRYSNPGNLPARTGAKVGTPEFAKYYGQWWADIRAREKANGWPEMICSPFDEPVKTPAKIANYLICYDAVKKAAPTTKLFCVFMNRAWAAEKLGAKADIWSCNGAFESNAAVRDKLAAAGGGRRLLYPYTMCTLRMRPGSVRWSTGFGPWKFGADGIYFWAYVWHSIDPFNDLDHGFSDWTPVARDIDGKLYDSLAWEGWREGVDDRRYVETAVRIAREKHRKDVLAKLDELRKTIVKAAEADHSLRTSGLDGFFMKIDNASLTDVYRARVVAMILEMLKAD